MNHGGSRIIKTDRLCLRPFSLEDKGMVYENYGCDEKIRKYISWIPCDTLEKTEEFIRFNIREYESNPKHYSWAIVFEGSVIGSVGIFNVSDDNDSGEIGYSLGSKWWSNGFMTEVCRAVIDYAFRVVGFNRVYATCHVDNAGSSRVLEKVGMSFEGVIRDGQKNLDGSFSNLRMYSVLRNEID